ncbi:hypothetical protein AN639_08690, partial [Candidatus Epulonipiscium fishelsonii]
GATRDECSQAALDTGATTTFGIFNRNVTSWLTDEEIDQMIDAGRVFVAETWEELVNQINAQEYDGATINMDVATLEKTITEHNGFIDAGEDTQFDKDIKATHGKIEAGPYYAVPQWPAVHHTMGGVTINSNAQVLNAEGNIIEGLYAAGEVTGGIHGTNRLGSNAVSDAVSFGYVAGTHAITGTNPFVEDDIVDAVANTFSGIAQGYKGPVTVDVTIDGTTITSVVVADHMETLGISDKAIADLPKSIVAGQTISLDTISGASFTSKAILEATGIALTEAGLDLANYQTAFNMESTSELADATYDVVIVGGGGAGLTGAIEAASQGASVVVIEKMPFLGGNTLISHGEMAMADTWLQEELGIQDSPELFATDMFVAGNELAKYEVTLALAEASGETAFWLRDFVGVEFNPTYLGQEGGHSVKRQLLPEGNGVGLVESLKEKATDLGVTFMLETTGETLIQDETGKVVAVEVSSGDQSATITANNGVILATGGFGENIEMHVQYNTLWPDLGPSMLSSNAKGITGDGILMASEIGANLQNMEQIQLYPFTDPTTGVFFPIEAPNWNAEGHVYVNQSGERFVNEFLTRYHRAQAILDQDGFVYCIYNQEVADRLDLEEDFAENYEVAKNKDIFYKAETLGEIAEHFNIDSVALTQTLEDYNAGAESGKDEFGREIGLVPMYDGPWFILKGTSAIHHTMGGVEIDEVARVINTEGEIIEGLYAAGEVVGSVHGAERVGSCAVADALVFGRIAGDSATNLE